MIKNKKISSTLNDKIFAVETQCDNFFIHVMNFQQTLLRNFKVKICKKKIAQEIEFLRREQLLPINISTLCLFTSRAAAESNSGVGSWEEEEEEDICSF